MVNKQRISLLLIVFIIVTIIQLINSSAIAGSNDYHDTIVDNQLLRTFHDDTAVRTHSILYNGNTDNTGMYKRTNYNTDGETVERKIYYDSNGDIEAIYEYGNDGEIDTAKFYYTTSTVIRKKNYYNSDGNIESLQEFDSDQKLLTHKFFFTGTTIIRKINYYNTSENLVSIKEFSADQKLLTHKFYFLGTTTIRKINYYNTSAELVSIKEYTGDQVLTTNKFYILGTFIIRKINYYNIDTSIASTKEYVYENSANPQVLTYQTFYHEGTTTLRKRNYYSENEALYIRYYDSNGDYSYTDTLITLNSINLRLYVNSATDFGGCSIDLKYDPSKFTVTDINLGSTLTSNNYTDMEITNDSGYLEYVVISQGGNHIDLSEKTLLFEIVIMPKVLSDYRVDWTDTVGNATALSLDGFDARILLSNISAEAIAINDSYKIISLDSRNNPSVEDINLN